MPNRPQPMLPTTRFSAQLEVEDECAVFFPLRTATAELVQFGLQGDMLEAPPLIPQSQSDNSSAPIIPTLPVILQNTGPPSSARDSRPEARAGSTITVVPQYEKPG